MKAILIPILILCFSIFSFAQSAIEKVNPISHCGANDGFIEIIAEGTAGPFNFQWKGPEGSGFQSTEQNIYNLSHPGGYSVMITSDFGVETPLYINLTCGLNSTIQPDIISTVCENNQYENIILISQDDKGKNFSWEFDHDVWKANRFDDVKSIVFIDSCMNHVCFESYKIESAFNLNKILSTTEKKELPKLGVSAPAFIFKVYPNPCENFIKIQINSSFETYSTLQINNLKGQNVFNEKVKLNLGINEFEYLFENSKFKYFQVVLINDDGSVDNKKVLKIN